VARGDILLVTLPESDRREEKGTRPAIAVQADEDLSPMLMVIPVTSSMGALRFPFTVEIRPSELNGLTLPSVAMVFQLRAIDRRRIVKKIGRLESEILTLIDEQIWQLLKPGGDRDADE
jgi:mRNA interferase MazF